MRKQPGKSKKEGDITWDDEPGFFNKSMLFKKRKTTRKVVAGPHKVLEIQMGKEHSL